jgi:hypothetical protein
MDVAPLVDGGIIVIWRLHHALADGTTALQWAKALLWDEVAGPAAPAPAPSTPVVAEISQDEARRRWQLAGFLAREFSEGGRSPFDGHVGTRREIGFATMRISELHGAAHRAGGATVNDALLSIVTGAVRRWVEAQHGRLPDIRVRVPVSLHHEADQAGNRDSFFSLDLPLHETDPVTRLREIHAATQRRKLHGDAEREDLLLRELTHVRSLSRFVTRLQASPRQFALCVSNVPGPRGPVSVLGVPVLSLSGLAEIGQRHALRVAAVSLGDQMSLGFCADPSIVPGVRLMAAAGRNRGDGFDLSQSTAVAASAVDSLTASSAAPIDPNESESSNAPRSPLGMCALGRRDRKPGHAPAADRGEYLQDEQRQAAAVLL